METKSGFVYEINEDVLDDWEFLETFEGLEKEDPIAIVKFVKKLLGKEQYEALKEHLRKKDGKVKTSLMTLELEDIMSQEPEIKKLQP